MASRPSLQTRPQETVVGPPPWVTWARGSNGRGLATDTVAASGRARRTKTHPWILFRANTCVAAQLLCRRLPCQSQWYFDATTSLALCCWIFEEANMDREEAGEGGEQRSKENMGVNSFFERRFQ